VSGGGEIGDQIRVVVADDQRAVLDGLALMLGLLAGITVAAVAADGAQTLAAAARHHRDVVLVGFLTKNAGRADIARAIQAAASGESILDAAVRAIVLGAAASGPVLAAPAVELPDGLTSREGDVLMLIGQGLSNSEIRYAHDDGLVGSGPAACSPR